MDITPAIRCLHCRTLIESTTATTHRWMHCDTESPHCTDGNTVQPDAQQLLRDTILELDCRYTLVSIGHNDGLTPRQIANLLGGGNEYAFDEWDRIADWESESRREAARCIVAELVGAAARDVLAGADDQLLEQLYDEIADRDDSDIVTDLLRNSDSTLFRYDLDFEVPDGLAFDDEAQRTTIMSDLALAAGLDIANSAVSAMLTDLVTHAPYGGRLYVMWYGDPHSAVDLAGPRIEVVDGLEVPRLFDTVIFSDAHLAVIDHWNGSGHTVAVPTITAAWTPCRVSIDAPRAGPGYSWHEIAGPVPPAHGGSYRRVSGNPTDAPALQTGLRTTARG